MKQGCRVMFKLFLDMKTFFSQETFS